MLAGQTEGIPLLCEWCGIPFWPPMARPTLPQALVNTDMPAPWSGATTHVCMTTAEFSTALINAVLGDIIELTAGNTLED
jgi:hypothetical protein